MAPPPHHLSGSAADNTEALLPVPPGGRLRVVPALLVGVAIGLLAAVLYGRANGAAPPPTVASVLQSAIQAVSGAEPDERVIFSETSSPPRVSPDMLPTGVPVIYCFYEIPGVKTPGAPVAMLSKDGKRTGPVPAADITTGTQPGTGTLALRVRGGFQPGVYEVELQFADSRVMASFVAAKGADAILAEPAPKDAQVTINAGVFASAVGAEGRPAKPKVAFAGVDKVFFVFQYDQAEPGSAVQVKWYGGQDIIETATREVLLPSVKGWANAWLQAPPPGLPPGKYRAAVNMSSDPHELAGAEFVVSAGQAPSPAPGSPNALPRP